MKQIKHSFSGTTESEKIQHAIEIMHRELRPHEVRAVLKGHCNAVVYATTVPDKYKYQRYCEVCRFSNGIPKIEVLVIWPNKANVILKDGDYRRKILSVQLRRLCRRLGLTTPAAWPDGVLSAIKRVKIGKRSAKIVTNDYRQVRNVSVPYKHNTDNVVAALMRLVCASDWHACGEIPGHAITGAIVHGGYGWIKNINAQECNRLAETLGRVRTACALN